MSLGAEVDKLNLSHPKAEELIKVEDVIKGTMRIKDLTIKKGKLSIK